MNERIKLLAEQAGMNAIEPVMDFDRKETHWNGWASAMEKFAELIVQECIGIVAKRKDQAIDDSCNVDEAMSMAEMDLEEHFGVEE